MSAPVVSHGAQVLAHVPGLARHGSKPSRVLAGSAELLAEFVAKPRK